MSRRWRRIAAHVIIVTLTTAMALISPPAIAVAAPSIDQQQTTIDNSVGAMAVGGSSEQKLAQIVTAGVMGDLVQIDLPAACTSSADLTIEIRNVGSDGKPGTTVLATETIAGSTIPAFYPAPASFRSFALSSPPNFAAGTKFSIVLTSNGTTVGSNCAVFQGPVGDPYSGGDLYFDARPNAPGWLRNCDSVSTPRCDMPFRTWVEPTGADLSITKTLMNSQNLNVFATQTWGYQIDVANSGPETATSVTVVDTLPANVTFAGASTGCVHSSGVVTCTLASLAVGSSAQAFIFVTFNNAGSYTNGATVSATQADPDTSDNSTSHTQQALPAADLSINELDAQVFVSPAAVEPGGTVTYDATIKNNGPDAAGDVVLIQTIPSGSSFVSITSPDTIFCGSAGTTNPNEYGCRFVGPVAVGAKRSMTVTITAPTVSTGVESTFEVGHNSGLILDPQTFNDSVTVPLWVVAESAQQSVGAGGTVTTETEGDGATFEDPIETSVKAPAAGNVSITEQPMQASAPTSWTLLGAEVVVSAPAGTADNPIQLMIRLDASFVSGYTASQIDVIRNNDFNNPVPNCSAPTPPTLPSSTTPMSPTPWCVYSRQTLSDGDVEIVVLTTQASVWNLGVHEGLEFGGFQTPTSGSRKAGSALPIRFTLFSDGEPLVDSDLNVIRALSSRETSCETGAPIGAATPAKLIGSGLHFDIDTNSYGIEWKTDSAWKGTCRELILQLIDGSEHALEVRFK